MSGIRANEHPHKFPHRQGTAGYRLALLFVVALLQGCASNSILIPYTVRAHAMRQGIIQGQYTQLAEDLAKNDQSGANRLLSLLELGRIHMLAHDPKDSLQDFTSAMNIWDAENQQARISLTHSAEVGASLFTNDNAIPYTGSPYERTMAHTYQALNYLALGQLSDAAVEIRRAEFEQRQALLDQQNTIAKVKQSAQQQGFHPGDYTRFFPGMNAEAGRVKNGFQNAMAFYISSLIYEAAGQPDDAYVDIKLAFEMWPDNPVLQQDMVRLGALTGSPEAGQLARRLGIHPPPAQDGSIVVMLEQGWIPQRATFKFPIITSNTVNYLAVPYYPGPFPLPQPESIQVDQQATTTLPLVDFEALAAFDLKEQMPALLARQWLRLLTKQKMQRELEKNGNTLGALLGSLATTLTDQADLRSWSTLPANSQLARFWLVPGTHMLSLGTTHLPIHVQSGHTTLVDVVDNGGALNIMTYQL